MISHQTLGGWGLGPVSSHMARAGRIIVPPVHAIHNRRSTPPLHQSSSQFPLALEKRTTQDASETHASAAKGWDVNGIPNAFVRGLIGMALGAQCLWGSWLLPEEASAVLNAPKALLPRSAEAALRRAIPSFNKDVGQIQSYMEDIQFSLRIPQRKPWGTIIKNVQSAEDLAKDSQKMLVGVPQEKMPEAQALISDILKGLSRVESAAGAKDQEKTGQRVADTLRAVADLELLQAPGLPFVIPKDYAGYPRLTGRATVEFVIKKGDGTSPFFTKGVASDQTTIEVVLDGYSAPISAGNFVSNVRNGLYNGKEILADRTAVAGGAGLAPGKSIPLEILPVGFFDPLYGSPIDVQSGERPVLPLSINGAISMARSKSRDYALASDEFFIYKFDRSQAGLAGMSFDEGNFGVFGYVVKGMDDVERLTTGDTIVAAKLISGEERFKEAR